MRAIIQRVKTVGVEVDNDLISFIENGYLIFLGIGNNDTKFVCEKLWRKIKKLRIFEDKDGKTNLNLEQINGSVMVVSQFTLFADIKGGNRPSFIQAAPPKIANELYEYFISLVRQDVDRVGSGIFGADMKVQLINDGPFTLFLDTDYF